VEISIYRLSDHALVRTWTATTHFPPNGDRKDRPYAYYTGGHSRGHSLGCAQKRGLVWHSPCSPRHEPQGS
jgi:hypothetical protein